MVTSRFGSATDMTDPKEAVERIVDRAKRGRPVWTAFDEDAETVARAYLALQADVTKLQERLEMTHAWRTVDGKMQRVAVELGSIPDGIECRDETIRLQDRRIEELQADAARMRAALEGLLRVREWVIAAGGTEGPLPQDVIRQFAKMSEAAYAEARTALEGTSPTSKKGRR
jgi:hypothetical protein